MPKPGIPESFKVLVKELQALCLDIKVLDENMDVIELADDDDDDIDFSRREEQRGGGSDEEFNAAGYGINEAEDGDADLFAYDRENDGDDGAEDVSDYGSDFGEDNDFAGEDNYGDGDFDLE